MLHALTIVSVLVHGVRVSRILKQDAEDGGEIPLHCHVEHGTLVVVDVHHPGTRQQLCVCVGGGGVENSIILSRG